MTIENYELKVADKFKEIAKNELREDDNRRRQALEQFRDWIGEFLNFIIWL